MLKFSKIEAGHYQADTDTRRYVITKCEGDWVVRVWKLMETAGIKHTIGLGLDDAEATGNGFDTKRLAVDVAARYEQLVTEGYGKLFIHMRPMTRAIIEAYNAESVQALNVEHF